MSKPLILTSPKGRAIFPHLTEPDTKVKTEGEYHVQLECNKAECEIRVEKIRDCVALMVQVEYEKRTNGKTT